MSRRALVLLALPLVPLVACTRILPPVATPGPAVPALPDDPVPEGTGRVYVDVVDGPAPVWIVQGGYFSAPACTTPCVLDLPYGPNVLAFPVEGANQVELADVRVGERPIVYRRALGWQRDGGPGMVLGILGATFGGMSFATGATLLPIGLATDTDGMTIAGGITLAAGAVLTAVGVWAIGRHPIVEQPGAGAQYDLPMTERPVAPPPPQSAE